jgi:hypothetical protein
MIGAGMERNHSAIANDGPEGCADVLTAVDVGTSLVVGTAGTDGEPRATRAWALIPHDAAACRLRVIMAADDETAVANLATGVVALTGADVRTLRSTQLKGRVLAVEPPSEDDLERVRRHCDSFVAIVEEVDGMPPELTRRMFPTRLVAVELEIDTRFDQSPGPGAGRVVDE